MSTALAIAGVTAVLRDLLNDGIVNHNVSGVLGSTVLVSTVPPDRVVDPGGTETAQINLFMHQVTPNAAWRNEGLPSRDSDGRTRLTNPPLALNLHYLLSAYAGGDLHGEILLGYAMQLLHETPVLTREAIRTALIPSPAVGTTLPPALRALAGCGLDRQVAQIRILPEYLNTEEISKLWTAIQSHYRPTAAYRVSVVLIEAEHQARAPLPVLSRGQVDQATHRERGVAVQPTMLPPYPVLDALVPLTKQAAAVIGDTLVASGGNLDGMPGQYALVLSNARLGIDVVLTPEAGAASATAVAFTLDPALSTPAGSYTAAVRLFKPGESQPRVTNVVPLVVAPAITGGLPATAQLDANNELTLTPSCMPAVRPDQRVSLILNGQEAIAGALTAPTTSPSFTFRRLAPGQYWVRLRVDGVDSLVATETSGQPPAFSAPRIDVQP
jgi:hypothetical protein